jgi:prophage maintenance system killer protein
MSSFPTEEEMILMNEEIADLLGTEAGLANPEMLRAVLLGVRLSRRGVEAHRGPFERAAALILELFESSPFRSANHATALAGALLYLERHGFKVEMGPGQASAFVEAAASGNMPETRLAALLRLRTTSKSDSRPAVA